MSRFLLRPQSGRKDMGALPAVGEQQRGGGGEAAAAEDRLPRAPSGSTDSDSSDSDAGD